MKKVAVAIHATEEFDIDSVKKLQNLDYIHVDVMDGNFVNNTMLNLDVFRILNESFATPIIAHLMVNDPSKYISEIIDFVDIFLFHREIEGNIKNIINKIQQNEKAVGLVINPPTPISSIESYLDAVDIILVMGVNPGWSGQQFIKNTIEKIDDLSTYKKHYQFQIDVDGGVSLENAYKLRNADILSSSSTILNAEDPNEIIRLLKTSDESNE